VLEISCVLENEVPAEFFSLRQDITGPELNMPELAQRYQVSEQAMWIQLFDHKLVPPQTMTARSHR
jgi:hypothetical protein